MTNIQTQPKINIQKSNLFTAMATMAGVVVGVVASLAMVGPLVHSEVASATKDATQSINARPASSVLSCSAPTGGSAANTNATTAKAKTAAVMTAPATGGKGGDQTPGQSGNGNNWVHSFVSGVWADTDGTISDTGNNSTNVVKTTNKNKTTVTNNNSISVSNSNSQTAKSGDVNSDKNTHAGTAASGNTANTNESSYDFKVTN